MHKNIFEFWQNMQNLDEDHEDRSSDRVNRLLVDMFESWMNNNVFPEFDAFGHIRDHFQDSEILMGMSINERRAHAYSQMLQMISGSWGQSRQLVRVFADELIVGNMPPYSVGQGKELMDYLTEEERLKSEISFLNPWSNFGHICPDYKALVDNGIENIISKCKEKIQSPEICENKKAFYNSIEIALSGVLCFVSSYKEMCLQKVKDLTLIIEKVKSSHRKNLIQTQIETMKESANRLGQVPQKACSTFIDAVQSIYILNCALHWTGELTSLGRLDQILYPYYKNDLKNGKITYEKAQEIIDCLWIKLDEQVLLNKRLAEDRFTSADGALLGVGGASNFDQGALINQWMQQVTIGGYIATEDKNMKDGCNEITKMCLNAARKFPFNCPTVDLRVNKKTPKEILKLATKAIKSGGAHPILMNDDKIIPALKNTHSGISWKSAKNYACDGCYETTFQGETEFSFFYIPGIDVLEKALNSGAGFAHSGDTHLRGTKWGPRTPPANKIQSFEDLYSELKKHIEIGVHRSLSGVLKFYGSKGKVCPSPILSSLIDGCIDSGRDFYDGGAKYKMFAPLMTGISHVADSLWIIDNFVFGEKPLFTLEELTAYLRSNWGTRADTVGLKINNKEAQQARLACINAPKFGYGNPDVDKYAWRLVNSFVDIVEDAISNSIHMEDFNKLKNNYNSESNPFVLILTPGVGTFEQYVFGGAFAGATPDGRCAFHPISSDLSPSPLPQDFEIPSLNKDIEFIPRGTSLEIALSSWDNKSFERLSDGAPPDLNIKEDFPEKDLQYILEQFSGGKGGNMLTITVADTESLIGALEKPNEFNLLRVRMGGWTEFFTVLSTEHQKQHLRRPIYHNRTGA